jgi:hypothetical protein
MSHTEQERRNFNFRYQPYANTPDGILISYLQTGDTVRSGKEMILPALRAFWLPLAYQQAGNFSNDELRQMGLICCNALEHQLAYIRLLLRLPMPAPTLLSPLSTPTIPQAIKMKNGINNSSSQTKVELDADNLLPGKGSFDDTTNLFKTL